VLSFDTFLEPAREFQRGLLISEIKLYGTCAYQPLLCALTHHLLDRNIHHSSFGEGERPENFRQKKDQPDSWPCKKGMSST
jgi:hypothetical protein